MKKDFILTEAILNLFGDGDGDGGAEASAMGADIDTEGGEDLEASYKELINGKYKDQYTKDTQRIINQRFKQTKGLEKQIADTQPVIDMLMQKYKIEGNDLGKLTSAINDDDAMWESAADDAGMTIDQYKQFRKLEQENARFAREKAEREQQEKFNAVYAEWNRQADELKQTFPDFDFNAEMQNPEFASMVTKGIPVEHAFKVLHMDDIVTTAMKTTASAAEKRVVDNIRARRNRPVENGAAKQSAFTYKSDVTKLTTADRREAVRRSARGETIGW